MKTLVNEIATFASFAEIEKHVNTCLDFNIPSLMVGPPACGKSERVKQIAMKRNADYITRPLQNETKGSLTAWFFVNKEEESFKPFFSPIGKRLIEAEKETIFHFQDLLLADPEVQKTIMFLVQLREVHGFKVSPHVKFVIDTNENTHGAGRSQANTAVNSRLAIFSGMPFDKEQVADAWINDYAIPNGIAPEIIYFIYTHKSKIYVEDIPRGSFKTFHSLRTWTNLSPFIKAGLTDPNTIQSIIGNEENVAYEFSMFCQNLADFKGMLKDIQANPNKAKLFESKDMQKVFTLAMMLACNFDKKTAKPFVEYIKRYGKQELVSVVIEFGCQFNPVAKETDVYMDHVAMSAK